ncbi:hypothetical protein GQX73_g1320 [Xylaria multiplex]|uniref:Thioesterase domain-containing protein n=1 Tax=Xylaria multiplex TaxID=323545 RepID=A0A7C8IU20_9PEZI|nr:hypothetical protein GQX73_g1320 [Xylaria multiplex]
MVAAAVHSILAWEPESEADLQFFQNIPWCAEIIKMPGVRAYRGDYPPRRERGMDPVIHGFNYRRPKRRYLTSKVTVFREEGILRYGSFLAEPGVLPTHDVNQSEGLPSGKSVSTPSQREPRSAVTASQGEYPIHIDIFTLGQALYGFPRTIHGGILCLLADGICGKTAFLHRNPVNQMYTAYTNTRFIKPMIIGQDGTITIMMKTQISRVRTTEGKIVVITRFEGPGGLVYATAESMVMEKIWKGRL